MKIDSTTKILIAVFIALIIIAIYCYGSNKPRIPTTRITSNYAVPLVG